MSVQPVSNISTTFTGKTVTTKNGNSYEKTNAAKAIGLGTGLVIAGGLMHSQLSALKTITGKKNLIEGFHLRGKSLNDIAPRVISRGDDGKIMLPVDKVSKRSKDIVKGFKKTLLLWGTCITALTTGIGAVADTSINSVRAKEADELAAKRV